MENPSYYAIIPANVRYSNLKPNAKLLYGEITALSNQKGYCWSSNNYFAELYGVTKNTISLWINQLKDQNFIHVEVIRNENKQVIKRLMTITKNDDRSQQSSVQGIIKNGEGINTSKNITKNKLSIRKEKFSNEVIKENIEILDDQQIQEFIDYWTECNKSETMKFEMERTWNTSKRMLRWKNNNNKWNKKPSEKNQKSKLNNAFDEWTKATEFIKNQQ
jgi:hypothetical protein